MFYVVGQNMNKKYINTITFEEIINGALSKKKRTRSRIY